MSSVALIGNIVNNFYREARVLRSSGVTAHLYIQRPRGPSTNTSDPRSDPTYSSEDSAWIFELPRLARRDMVGLFVNSKRLLSANLRKALDQFGRYDLIVISGPETVLCPMVPNAVVFRPTGSDLTVMPSLGWLEKVRLGRRRWTLHDALAHMWERTVYRRAIRSSEVICVSLTLPTRKSALQRIGVDRSRMRAEIPLFVDAEAFAPTAEQRLQGQRRWPELSKHFVVFWPARMMFSRVEARGVQERTGQWKGSEIGLHGFSAFLERLTFQERMSAILVIPDRSLSDDLLRAKKLIAHLQLAQNVLFVAGDSRQGLTRIEMLQVLANAVAVLDAFGSGGYGAVAVEASAAGIPLITYAPNHHYPDRAPLPFLNAQDSQEIADHLYFLWQNRPEINRIGVNARQWVNAHHGAGALMSHYAALMSKKTEAP